MRLGCFVHQIHFERVSPFSRRTFSSLSFSTFVSSPIRPFHHSVRESRRWLSTTESSRLPSGPIHLTSIRDNIGARTRRTRLGRGPSSGKGKTAGRGHKGQKARSGNGKPTPGFAGGQKTFLRTLPKLGMTSLYVFV